MKKKIKKYSHAIFVMLILWGGFLGYIYSVKAYPQAFAIDIKNNAINEFNPNKEVVIDFSDPVLPKSILGKISIFPETDVEYFWKNSNRQLVIKPKKIWQLETDYSLSLAGRSIMLTEFISEINFKTQGYPKISKIYPEKGSVDLIMDIEDPITVEFDKPINDYSIKFTLDPFENVATQIDDMSVKIMPKEGFKKGQRYSFDVSIRHKQEADMQKIYDSYFDTKPEEPKTREEELALRVKEAKKNSVPKITTGKYIDINLQNQIMTLFQDGRVVDTFLVSSGKSGMWTPVMETKVYNKHPRAFSKKYNLFMPFWMAIVADGKIGIHELPEWANGYKEGANHLGIPVSHGCIRLGVGAANIVYDFAEIGTPVITY